VFHPAQYHPRIGDTVLVSQARLQRRRGPAKNTTILRQNRTTFHNAAGREVEIH